MNGTNGRLVFVDALRGYALMGLFLIHMVEYFELYWLHPEPGPVNTLMFALFGGKAYAIFALLFGLSFYIILDRQAGAASIIGSASRGAFPCFCCSESCTGSCTAATSCRCLLLGLPRAAVLVGQRPRAAVGRIRLSCPAADAPVRDHREYTARGRLCATLFPGPQPGGVSRLCRRFVHRCPVRQCRDRAAFQMGVHDRKRAICQCHRARAARLLPRPFRFFS